MRRIQFNENFLQLVNLVDLKHLQDANEETAEGVISSFLPAGVNACVLSGCQVTKNGNDYTVTAGFIYFSGVIYPVEAHSFNTINVPYWAFILSYLDSDPIPLSNGNTFQAHQVGKAQLVNNLGQPELIGAYNEVYTVQQYVANMANVGAYEFFDAGFDMYDAQGAGIGYCVGWQICNGQNGAPDLKDRFIMTPNVAQSNVGAIGGANEVVLTINQIPDHVHTTPVATIAGGGANGGLSDTTGATTDSGKIKGRTAATDAAEGHENRPAFYVLAIRRRMV